MEPTLYAKLTELSRSGRLPMHMPGHKRNVAEFGYLAPLGGAYDITEIDGFDNLHDAHGAIADICGRAAELWGARKTFLSVNGSTGALLAAVNAAVPNGGKILVARNCHKSVFNAAELAGAEVVCLYPPSVNDGAFYGGISADAVRKELVRGDFSAVVITSPTYEGVISDIKSVADAAHEYGAVLIVDGAHGAHLDLSPYFTGGGVSGGADITVVSLHKTLPALTQTALLHVNSDRIDVSEIARQMAIFVTSSPSYVLMASVDGMLDYLKREGKSRFEKLYGALKTFYGQTVSFGSLRVSGGGWKYGGGSSPDIFKSDISKIYIDTVNSGLNGYELKNILSSKYGTDAEYASCRGVLCMAAIGDDERSLDRLLDALRAIDADCVPNVSRRNIVSDIAVRLDGGKVVESRDAVRAPAEFIAAEDAAGRVSAECVWLYPPGTPVLRAGERIGCGFADCIRGIAAAGGEIKSDSGGLPRKVRVVKE